MRKIILSIIMVGLLSFGLFGLDIFYDNFDNNQTRLNGWKESSSTNVTRYTGSYKVGSAAMELKGSSNATAYINIAPYKNMKLTYRMAKNSLESGEKLICQYNIGSGWVTAATLLNTAANGTYTSYTTTIPNANVLQVKFVLNGNAADDYGYVDEVKLVGDRK